MNHLSPMIIALAVAGLSACASHPSCDLNADYRKAAAIPPIQAADGLNLPTSPSALKVPDITPEAAAAARQPLPRKGKGTACLDYPPEMLPTDAAPPPPKS